MEQELSKKNPEKFLKLFKYITYNVYSYCYYKERLIKEKGNSIITEEDVIKNYETDKRFGIPVIVFDKFVTFLIRFWNTHYAPNPEVTTNSFYHFLKTIKAKHGRRVARFGSNYFSKNRLHYVTDIINNLEKRGVDCGLCITPKNDVVDDDQKEEYEDFIYYLDAENPEKFVTYSQILSDPKLGDNFNIDEIKFVETTAELIAPLNIEELRAIGTHCNYDETKEDIIKEYHDIYKTNNEGKELSFLDNLIVKIQSDEQFFNEAKLVLSYIEEAYRKSNANKKFYISAYGILLSEIQKKKLSNPLIESSLNKCQNNGEDIWKDDIKEVFEKRSYEYFLKMFYIYFIGYYQLDKNKKKNPDSFKLYHYYTWGELLSQFENHLPGFVKFNSISDYYLNHDSVLRQEIKNQIISVLEEMKVWIKKLTDGK